MKRLVIPALAVLAACTSGNHGWSVEGTVKDGEGRRMAIEAFNAGNWYAIDSVSIGRDGAFSYRAEAPAAIADVYRLIAESVAARGPQGALTDSILKSKLNDIAIHDSTCIAAYYIINKNIGGRSLYDLSKRRDLSIVGAVAQRFTDNRPDDARTQWLTAIFLKARQLYNPQAGGLSMQVQESGLIDIVRYDNKGHEQSLAAIAGKGHPVVLSFTSYDLESSPAYNVVLADLRGKYAANGLEIYQIAFDADEVEWKQKADNLPWITVWNSPVDGTDVLMKYNVGALPVAFVIDGEGVIRERVIDPAKLDAAVAKVL